MDVLLKVARDKQSKTDFHAVVEYDPSITEYPINFYVLFTPIKDTAYYMTVTVLECMRKRVFALSICAFVRSSAESADLTCALKRQIRLRLQI